MNINMNISILAVEKWENSKINRAENAREAAYHIPFKSDKASLIGEDLVFFEWDSLMESRAVADIPKEEKIGLYERDLFGLSKILVSPLLSDATRGYLEDILFDLQYEKTILELGFEEGVILFN